MPVARAMALDLEDVSALDNLLSRWDLPRCLAPDQFERAPAPRKQQGDRVDDNLYVLALDAMEVSSRAILPQNIGYVPSKLDPM